MIVPTATYRLQFRGGMDFERAAQLAPYWKRLGISHLYASPVFEAVPGSTHGYDIARYDVVEASLGGREGLERLSAALKREGLGLILDFVPNHMGASPFNSWWCDLLEWGEKSPHASYFDIDWTAPKLLIPTLPEPYGIVLDNGGFGLDLDDHAGGINFTVGDWLKLPLTPPSYAAILAHAGSDSLDDIANRFAIATPETTPELKADFAARLDDDADAAKARAALAKAAADADTMHQLHEAQIWRLAYWRAARETLTYRRFFEVTDLVGVRMEQPSVFEESHKLILDLVQQDIVQGIRLDHVDGLADPLGYFRRLQDAAAERTGSEEPYFLLVEKILEEGEELRSNWPVAGTTGYEFITSLGELLTAPEGEQPLSAAYDAFIGESPDYVELLNAAKRHIFVRNLAGELDVLTGLAHRLAEADLVTRDFGRDTLRRAIIALAAGLPVYRTYVDVDGPSEEDEALIAGAVIAAKASREIEDELAIDFIARIWRLDLDDPAARAEALTFATRLQQTTGPLMAKAVEDTLFYRYNRLIALNEVGGEPDVFGEPLQSFHDDMLARLKRQPQGLSATSTHDSKRGEDARARLYGLSETPGAWSEAVGRWAASTAHAVSEVDGDEAPTANDRWLFFQSLAGAWPFGLEPGDGEAMAGLAGRLAEFMLKAVREAKVKTSWTGRNEAYEEAVERFVRTALDHGASGEFLGDFARQMTSIMVAGGLNSLAQTLVKLTAPGIPDLYQGAELWELSLVDPDNRRPVDFDALSEALQRQAGLSPQALIEDWQSGDIKLRVIEKTLKLRRDQPELFAAGAYAPLPVSGKEKGSVLAFSRSNASFVSVTVVPVRAGALLAGSETPHIAPAAWADTLIALPGIGTGRAWRNALTGEDLDLQDPHGLPVAAALEKFPVALLTAPLS